MGYRISPLEIEKEILSFPEVKEAIILPYLQKDKTLIQAVISPKNLKEKEEEIKNYLKRRLSSYKIPHIFRFVEEIPKTSTGKIKRNAPSL